MLLQINVAADSLQNVMNENGEMMAREETLSIWELIASSGVGGIIIMLALFILSVVAVYIYIERYMVIRKAAREDVNFMNKIKDTIHEGKLESARVLCQSTPTPIARMIEKGVSRIGKPLNDIAAAVENSAKLELYKLEKNLATLATIAGAAPMIGFLGTVIGMILAFHEMASAGGNLDVGMLAEGIYTALMTTVAGLVVGILAFIGYNTLVAKVEKVVFMMEARSTEFLDILNEPSK